MHHVVAAAALLTAAAAAFIDMRRGRIPDALTYGALGFGLGVSCILGMQTFLCTVSAVAFVILIATYVETASFRLCGGDIKLMAALGAILGILGLVFVTLGVFVILHVIPPKITRPMAPIIFGAVVFSVTMKEVLGC